MDLRQATYVVAVVDEGTFTAAAASIPVSQPALSQAVAALERELGTPLFHPRLGHLGGIVHQYHCSHGLRMVYAQKGGSFRVLKNPWRSFSKDT